MRATQFFFFFFFLEAHQRRSGVAYLLIYLRFSTCILLTLHLLLQLFLFDGVLETSAANTLSNLNLYRLFMGAQPYSISLVFRPQLGCPLWCSFHGRCVGLEVPAVRLLSCRVCFSFRCTPVIAPHHPFGLWSRLRRALAFCHPLFALGISVSCFSLLSSPILRYGSRHLGLQAWWSCFCRRSGCRAAGLWGRLCFLPGFPRLCGFWWGWTCIRRLRRCREREILLYCFVSHALPFASGVDHGSFEIGMLVSVVGAPVSEQAVDVFDNVLVVDFRVREVSSGYFKGASSTCCDGGDGAAPEAKNFFWVLFFGCTGESGGYVLRVHVGVEGWEWKL